MTLLERYKSEKSWRNKCLLLELIHLNFLSENSKWTVRNTAKLVRQGLGTVSENLQLARIIRSNDLISGCKSRNKAIKLMRLKNK